MTSYRDHPELVRAFEESSDPFGVGYLAGRFHEGMNKIRESNGRPTTMSVANCNNLQLLIDMFRDARVKTTPGHVGMCHPGPDTVELCTCNSRAYVTLWLEWKGPKP